MRFEPKANELKSWGVEIEGENGEEKGKTAQEIETCIQSR